MTRWLRSQRPTSVIVACGCPARRASRSSPMTPTAMRANTRHPDGRASSLPLDQAVADDEPGEEGQRVEGPEAGDGADDRGDGRVVDPR